MLDRLKCLKCGSKRLLARKTIKAGRKALSLLRVLTLAKKGNLAVLCHNCTHTWELYVKAEPGNVDESIEKLEKYYS